MTPLRQIAGGYVATRRSLGYQMDAVARLLNSYIDYLEASGAVTVTVANALEWATRPADALPIWWCRRLSVVRGFARHLSAFDRSCQVPPTNLLAVGYARVTSYIYSTEEVDALVHAAGTLAEPLAEPLPAASCQAVISLLAVTGMRVGEAVALARCDVDLEAGIITVVKGKYGASRHVPLHPSTVEMLDGYARRRDRICPAPAADRFFVTSAGTAVSAGWLEQTFAKLLAQAQITTPPGRRRPRIHDLRHRFAVVTLRNWYRDGVDVRARLPLLSTMLGHVAPAATYWYLTATPDLLALAAQRLHDHLGELP
ncbi:MAG TPA: tyrosine-type recombinase/integrase [Candidatus Limnocylindrales bacterium]|nr:tyrosine-type recombinase/integrase [Candidatus Limnocylindrales bacterium]